MSVMTTSGSALSTEAISSSKSAHRAATSRSSSPASSVAMPSRTSKRVLGHRHPDAHGPDRTASPAAFPLTRYGGGLARGAGGPQAGNHAHGVGQHASRQLSTATRAGTDTSGIGDRAQAVGQHRPGPAPDDHPDRDADDDGHHPTVVACQSTVRTTWPVVKPRVRSTARSWRRRRTATTSALATAAASSTATSGGQQGGGGSEALPG